MAEVHVKGLRELNAFLQQLPPKIEANVMRGALRAGMNVVKAQVIANVPVDSGLLRDGIKVGTRSRRGIVTANVKAKGKHAHLAHWIEFGTKAHEIIPRVAGSLFLGGIFRKVVSHPGQKPRPFMRPALDSQAQSAIVAAAEYMKRRLATKHGIDTAHIRIEGDE